MNGEPILKEKDKKKKKKSIKSIRNSCDALLTPIIKQTTPKCEGCGRGTEVAHHWIEKSRSLNLRYDFRNLVALCHSCHAKIHNRFGNSVVGGLDVAMIVISKRGEEWKRLMDIEGRKTIKNNVEYFEKHLAILKEKLNK
jgi:hypothetical protein